MAAITLTRDECERGMLPDVCMFCGAPATTDVRRCFTWHPTWLYVLLLLNLIGLIVILVRTREMRLRLPACTAHERAWRRGMRIALASIVALLTVGVLTLVWIKELAPDGRFGTWIVGAEMVVGIAGLTLMLLRARRSVRPTRITRDELTLTNVAPAFVDALATERADDLETRRRRARRPIRTPEEVDYDDRA